MTKMAKKSKELYLAWAAARDEQNILEDQLEEARDAQLDAARELANYLKPPDATTHDKAGVWIELDDVNSVFVEIVWPEATIKERGQKMFKGVGNER